MAWLESHQTLANHPKTLKLARLLNVPRVTAVGHLHFLWWWALDYAQDGNLSKFDELDIAVAADWQGEPTVFLDGLKRAGFLDESGDIHDWNEYAGRLVEQRELQASRKRRNRGLYNDDELIRLVRARDGDSCRYCNKMVNWADRRGGDGGTYDHVDPNAEHENTLENIVVACRSCNSAKGKRTPEEAQMFLTVPIRNTASNGTKPAVIQPNRTKQNQTRQNRTQSGEAHEAPSPEVLAPAAPARVKYSPLFEVFWREWNTGVTKGRGEKLPAYTEWKRQGLDQPGADLIRAEVLEGLLLWKASVRWREEGGRYVKHAERWLKARGWESDPPDDAEPRVGPTHRGKNNDPGAMFDLAQQYERQGL